MLKYNSMFIMSLILIIILFNTANCKIADKEMEFCFETEVLVINGEMGIGVLNLKNAANEGLGYKIKDEEIAIIMSADKYGCSIMGIKEGETQITAMQGGKAAVAVIKVRKI
jgi:hypothetical protein